MSKSELSSITAALSILEDLVDEAILDAALEEHLAQPVVRSSSSPSLRTNIIPPESMEEPSEAYGADNVYLLPKRNHEQADSQSIPEQPWASLELAADDGQAPEAKLPDLSPDHPDLLGKLTDVPFRNRIVDVEIFDDGRSVYLEVKLVDVPKLLAIQREQAREETFVLRRLGETKYLVEGMSPLTAEEAYYAVRASQSASFTLR